MTAWTPFREPLRATLTRTVLIALVAGAVLASLRGGLARWPIASLLMFWPSFGGHWVELWFLNWLRPRLPERRSVQVVARLIVWFVGGILLGFGVWLTAIAFGDPLRASRVTWWGAGLAFIGIELVVQLVLQFRGQPSFLNGRG